LGCSQYPFDVVVPENSELIPLEDGGAVLRGADGSMLGSFASPWAKDAVGTAVPTRFLIENNRLIQRVHFSANSAFSVVADPFWLPVLYILAHVTRHAAMQAAKRGVSRALIQQVIRNGVRTGREPGDIRLYPRVRHEPDPGHRRQQDWQCHYGDKGVADENYL